MKRQYSNGDKFTISDAALENYGDKYRGRVFTVRQWFDHSVSMSQMASSTHGHPGFDECAGSALYEADGLNFALYEWEMNRATIPKATNIPNCPRCNGETELDGTGGHHCYFCGHSFALTKV